MKREKEKLIKKATEKRKNYNEKSLPEKLFAIKYYIQWIKYWMF